MSEADPTEVALHRSDPRRRAGPDGAKGDSSSPALVVATCAVAGSGKTTFARRLEAGGFVRLSIDQVVWQRFGAHGVDSPADRYDELSSIAGDVVRHRLVELVAAGADVVLDLTLWRRVDRSEYRALVENAEGRPAGYLHGFETPTEEGEVVLTSEQAATWWPPPHR